MHSRLVSFLEPNSIIYSRQFGFRKSHSTVHALINLVERIRQCLDNSKVAVGIFVDLQKAFDTVDHQILCHKLNHYGIRGIANRWFSSYLSFRYHFNANKIALNSEYKPNTSYSGEDLRLFSTTLKSIWLGTNSILTQVLNT